MPDKISFVMLRELTEIGISVAHVWNSILCRIVAVEMIGLKRVEKKIPNVLIHVCPDDSSIKLVNDPSTVYNLKTEDAQPVIQ
jgi:hypothetical protein